jgi:hypothetical protein
MVFSLSILTQAADDDLIACWRLDEVNEGATPEDASGLRDTVQGQFKVTPGVAGSALKFDGFTTLLVRDPVASPRLGQAFTLEAWVALGAYPWNWCPIICRHKGNEKGFSFAVGPRGQLSLQLALDGQWETCTSNDFALPLRKWVHVAGTRSEDGGIAVFVNGKEAGRLNKTGRMDVAEDMEMRIGMNHTKKKPSNIHREFGTLPTWFSFDGIMDEIKIHGHALTPGEIAEV